MMVDEKDLALKAVKLITSPGEQYAAPFRRFQGIPTIERTGSGRFWAAYYSGGTAEGPDNYVLVTNSEDGCRWSAPLLVIDPPGRVRAFDPCLWLDPQQRLWLFWAQSYGLYDGRCGVWASICSNPDGANPQWSAPRRIAHGIMLNKPTVLTTGEWLLPIAVWMFKTSSVPDDCYSNVFVSTDQGATFSKRGFANVPNRHCDEHMIVERKDGSLWMLVRTTYGIGESVSFDKGKTWSPGKPTRLGGPNSRFFIRRLRSGRLLLVNHYGFRDRSHLTAQLSDDDGLTWNEGLLLDERSNISYPDGVEAQDGTIYVIYDRERFRNMEILMAVFTEDDVLAESCVSPQARLKAVVNKAGMEKSGKHDQDMLVLLKYRNLLLDSKPEHPSEELDDDAKATVQQAIQYIEDHLLLIRDLKEVSDALGYSLPHLSRLFTKELGIALHNYYIKRKWQKTVDLLEAGSLSITQIATIMQYESIHTFSRAFKNAIGLSPSQYVRKYKETCGASEMMMHSTP
ncbi:MAG: BNR/Asp-box repeat protein [Paenibacillus sp.]|nr:BNR/Asp-box repeat protein [Paenibacillus sp.]